MALWLGAPADLAKDQGSVLAPTWQHTAIHNSNYRKSDTLFWPL